MARDNRWSGFALLIVALLGGLLFSTSMDRLWPMVNADVTRNPDEFREPARRFLEAAGFDLEGYDFAGVVLVYENVLDYAESTFGRGRTQAWIGERFPLVVYQVGFKKEGEPRSAYVFFHPDGKVLGWRKQVEPDDPGPSIEEDAARSMVRAAMEDRLGIDLPAWTEKSVDVTVQPNRTDYSFTLERMVSEDPEFREKILGVVAGDRVVRAYRYLVVPGAARRAARAAGGPEKAMQSIGFGLLGIAALAAFWIFLTRLRDGGVRLTRAAVLACFIFACLLATWLLQTGSLFQSWEPLWPRWISTLQYLVFRSSTEAWMILVLLALIGAGDALDREAGAGRGRSLWLLARGKILDPAVGAASRRGFLIGWICGGVLAGSVIILQTLAGARTALQPRAFFFYALNSASPAFSTLLFFLNVALLEELGYRFFAGTWLNRFTGRRWVAILAPAAIYGLTHTGLGFLPPAEPFWGRAVVMTLVGCVWGWAFFRYDALTVVLSHWTADLFIFNWPRISSGKNGLVVLGLITVLTPLLPAILGWAAGLLPGRGRTGGQKRGLFA